MARATTVFVTGASGFIGSAVLHGLVEAGFVVRALVRPGSPRDHLPDHGVRLVEGDIRDRESIRSAITGARYVFHVAADYRLWSRDRNEIFTTNISGTRIVMEEALRAGVERVVYTSSVATLAPRPDCRRCRRTLSGRQANRERSIRLARFSSPRFSRSVFLLRSSHQNKAYPKALRAP